jgi:hypothetical protein
MSDQIIFGEMPRDWKPAEIVPHPAWTRRVADGVLREIGDLASPSWRRKCLTDAVRAHRKQLAQIGVAPARIKAEIDALEMQLFPKPLRRRA